MRRKVIGWNINQRSGVGKEIPGLVSEELLDQNADIIVLTEVVKNDSLSLFIEKMQSEGYEAAISNNEKTNEVCILWKRELYRLVSVDDSLITAMDNDNPNYLMAVLKDQDDQEFNVVGYRIRVGSKDSKEEYEFRARQMHIVTDKLSELSGPTMVVTDSNNLRRGTKAKEWNLSVLDSMLAEVGYKRNTPTGSSIFAANPDQEDYEFAEDHIITNGVNITDIQYDREFVQRDTDVYKWGKDFTRHVEGKKYYEQTRVGYPDHAIVKGYFEV
jgi:mRNA deadenylase 3'-5' endonuclease subunit Ccr4